MSAHIDGHEPDNERGVWCCQEHARAFHGGEQFDGWKCQHGKGAEEECLWCDPDQIDGPRGGGDA